MSYTLNRRQRAVFDTLLPSGAHPTLKLGLFDVGFDEFYAEFRREANVGLRFGLSAALWVATWVAPLLAGKLPPLSRLSREDREASLEALGCSKVYMLRQMMLILKTIASFCYGADLRVRDAIGFPRQPA